MFIRFYTRPRLVRKISRSFFWPSPKVDSAVVRLIPKAAAEIVPLDEALFSRVVLTAFSQRRKTLRNTLSGVLDAEGFSGLGIDAGQRAENLPLSDYERIALYLMQA